MNGRATNRKQIKQQAFVKLAHKFRPPLTTQTLLFTPPGMIVSPPTTLEQTLDTPIAKSGRTTWSVSTNVQAARR